MVDEFTVLAPGFAAPDRLLSRHSCSKTYLSLTGTATSSVPAGNGEAVG
ncbi:MAG: hypothetical protein ABI140_01720 [Jatrophihabitantaceae bacterium]